MLINYFAIFHRDAKIAALERTSQESEKIIAEARTERLKHMDDLHIAHKKSTELEGKIKDLESKLAEKDAMIKVLQQHSREKDAVLQKTMFAHRAPGRHMRSASTMGLTSAANVISPSAAAAARSVKEDPVSQDNSSGAGAQSAANDSSKHRLDEQLKELDSRLTNKVIEMWLFAGNF